jgi:hypothetical protein
MACQAGRPGRRRHRPSPASVPSTTSLATLYTCAPGLRTLARQRRTAPRLLRRAAGTRPRRPVPPPPPNSPPRRPTGQAKATMSFTRSSRAQPPASCRRRSTGVPQPAQDQAGELADRRRPDCGRPSSSPPTVRTPTRPPRSPLRFSLLTRAPGSLGRRRRHPP